MFFNHPILLTGLAASVIPLVLHLLSRAQFKTVEWGAMMFLGTPGVAQQQNGRLKQLLLLMLRMAVIGLLAMALARPVVVGRKAPAIAPPRTTAVILFDRSASMALTDNGRTRFDMAREALFQVVPGLKNGDDLWLVPLGEPFMNGPLHVTSPQELSERVKEVGPAAGAADIADGLKQAMAILDGCGNTRQEIYIICDHQAGSWSGIDAPFAAEFRRHLGQFPSPPRLFVIPVGTDESENVAIESVDLVRTPAIVGQANQVDVRIRNYSGLPRPAVEVKVGNSSTPVNCPANGTATVRLPLTFYDSGPQLVTAEINAPGLLVDKRYDLAVEVLKELRVLIVDGEDRDTVFRSESDFLHLALTPYRSKNKDLAVVTVISPDDAASTDLSPFRVIILTNLPQIDQALARSIEQYVYSGGGLLVAPGDKSRVESYNERLFRQGDGILPAELQPAIPESDATITSVAHLELSHPIFAFLRNRLDPAPPAVVRRYFPVTPRDYGVSILASYGDGRPFLLETTVGHGHVLLMTTTVDIDWNTLALTSFFLPFAQSSVQYLAQGRLPSHDLVPGQPLLASIEEPIDYRQLALKVTSPGAARGQLRQQFGDASQLSVAPSGTRLNIRYEQTQSAGVYRLLGKRSDFKPLAMFVVRTPAVESDLTPLTRARWEQLEQQLGFSRIDPDRRTISAAQEVARRGWNLWLPLLTLVIAASLLELLLARRWSKVVA